MDDDSGKGKGRPWWRRSDAELMADRYREVKKTLGLEKVELKDSDREALIEEARRRDPNLMNLLDVVFVRSDKVTLEGEFVIVPVYRSDRGRRLAGRLGLRTTRRVRLDRYGLAVWDLIDGESTVERIGEGLKERFGDSVEPLYPRLARFMGYLLNLGLISQEKGGSSPHL